MWVDISYMYMYNVLYICYLSLTEFTTAVQYYKQHIHFQFVFQNPKKNNVCNLIYIQEDKSKQECHDIQCKLHKHKHSNVQYVGKPHLWWCIKILKSLPSKHLLSGHFAQEANEIWYPGKLVNVPPRYQI